MRARQRALVRSHDHTFVEDRSPGILFGHLGTWEALILNACLVFCLGCVPSLVCWCLSAWLVGWTGSVFGILPVKSLRGNSGIGLSRTARPHAEGVREETKEKQNYLVSGHAFVPTLKNEPSLFETQQNLEIRLTRRNSGGVSKVVLFCLPEGRLLLPT
ncbi:unnamed protein product [Hapterophycus canaliculatus]